MTKLLQDSEEYLKYINRFRVKELKDLLEAARLTKSGYKSALIERCKTIPLDERIQLIVKTLFASMGYEPDSPYVYVPDVTNKSIKATPTEESQDLTQSELQLIESIINKCRPKTTDPVKVPTFPAKVQVNKNMKSFNQLAFHKELFTIVEARELKNEYGSSNAQLQHCAVVLKNIPDEAINSCYIVNGVKQFKKQVHIRFGYIEKDSSNTIEDGIPPDLQITINGSVPEMPEQKKRTPNQPVNRFFRTIDITYLLKKDNHSVNDQRIKIFWKNTQSEQRKYYIGIYVVEQKKMDDLFEDLIQSRTLSEDYTTDMIKSKLQTSDEDFQYETNSLVVSLKCPLMASRISLPGRSTTCSHVQCFDLKSYLVMNENKPLWTCPVCSQKAAFESLRVDSLFRKIISENCEILEVSFNQDGSWVSTLNTSKQESGYNSNEETCEVMETEEQAIVISLDSDSDSSSHDIIEID